MVLQALLLIWQNPQVCHLHLISLVNNTVDQVSRQCAVLHSFTIHCSPSLKFWYSFISSFTLEAYCLTKFFNSQILSVCTKKLLLCCCACCLHFCLGCNRRSFSPELAVLNVFCAVSVVSLFLLTSPAKHS